MSRIFDALHAAQALRRDKVALRTDATNLIEFHDRRHGRRLEIDVPVYVYGHKPGDEPFHEETHTLHVSGTGALLLLSNPVEPGDKLFVTNEITEMHQVCVVIHLGKRYARTTEVGITFIEPTPGFWSLPLG